MTDRTANPRLARLERDVSFEPIGRTPAFVYDEATIVSSANRIKTVASEAGFSPLYSLKALPLSEVLHLIAESVDGFSTSSLFEAKVARKVLGEGKSVHFTSPGLREDEVVELTQIVDYITFNSLSQWSQYRAHIPSRVSCGLRINPQLSLVSDSRYDPCRNGSKLGVTVDDLMIALQTDQVRTQLEGLHFHTNCDSTDFDGLYRTVSYLHRALGSAVFERLRWINMGGGYVFLTEQRRADLEAAVDMLRGTYGLEIFLEPGAAFVREAGSLISAVVDIVKNNGRLIAVLDTTVNHMPEVFEYQFEPDVLGHSSDGVFEYTLVGNSCLAGDLFGEYAFDHPLQIGSRVVFPDVGAYALVKAHMFNGINLPDIYMRTLCGELMLKKSFSYADFASRFGFAAS